ncbi:MAG: hypothetical protein K2I23_05560 [Clostridia bacterium]|nr:hypothetical protein [Clostridia bacterium]
MEIIAKKSKSAFFVYFTMFIIGIITLPLGIYGLFFVGDTDIHAAWLLSLPLALMGVGASSLSKQLTLSFGFNLITLNNDTLIIGNNKYIIKICELQAVKAEKEFGNTGKLTLITKDQSIQVVSIAQYERAYARLLELKAQGVEPSDGLSKNQI